MKDILALVGLVVVVNAAVKFYQKHIQGSIERKLADIFDEETARSDATGA